MGFEVKGMDHSEDIVSLGGKTLSRELLSELWEERFLKNGSLWGRVYSGSMRPLIRVNDRVFVERLEPRQLRFGDIVLFKTENGLVIHRVLGKWRAQGALHFLQKGDFNPDAECVSAACVLGRVRAVDRDGAVVNFVSGKGYIIQVAMACYSLAAFGMKQAIGLISGKLPFLRGHGWGKRFDQLGSSILRFLLKVLGLKS